MNAFLFTTTDPDSLYYRLEKKLFSEDAAFRQLIIVPHRLVKETLFSKLLSGGVATGFKVTDLGPGIDYLLRTLRFEEKKGHSFPAPMIFALHLQALLKEFLETDNPLFASLKDYLRFFTETHGLQTRLQELAEALSLDFLHYGVYGGIGLERWLKNTSWQTELFKKAFDSWDYPQRALGQIKIGEHRPLDLDIHIFGFSFLPKIYDTFFTKLSHVFKIHHYYLTPTKEYFGLTRSNKEKAWLERQGEYLEDLQDNPLLANFGKQTRRRFLSLLEKELYLEEFFYENPDPISFLQKVQHAIFSNHSIAATTTIEQLDDSFEVHKCFSHKREIETLLGTLMRLSSKEDIEPSDIIVLAPDISVYFSYIKETFDQKSPFEVSIAGLEIQSQSSFLQAFSCLIEVIESRFEKKDLMKLLGYPLIRSRFNIDVEQIEKIAFWLDKAHFMWGYNLQHKKEILLQVCEKPLCEIVEEGTLCSALKKLLLGLTTQVQDVNALELEPFYPIEAVSNNDFEVFADFLKFTTTLWEQRQELINQSLTLELWILKIKRLLEQFFHLSLCSDDEGFAFFNQQLSTLEQLSFKIPQARYSFFHLKRVFEKTFTKKSAVYAPKNKNVIRFASLSSQQMVPSKVIVFLGMEESSFPKSQATYPLREIAYATMDAYPLMIEEQRQFLFDSLLYAKNHLIFSYCYFDESDGKQQECSYLLKEFLEVLDQSFIYQGQPITKHLTHTHKALRFDHRELCQAPYFILRDYELACAFYKKTAEKRPLFPQFYNAELKSKDEEKKAQGALILSELQQFARNPLKFYMKDALGLKIVSDQNERMEQKEFFLSSLDKSIFIKETLQHGKSSSWKDQNLKGALPQGFLGKISKDGFEEEKNKLFDACCKLCMDPEEFFTLELSALCQKPEQVNSKHLIVPALEVILKDNTPRVITGQIDLCHPKGLAFISRHDFSDLLRVWPIYLVFLSIIKRDALEHIEQNAVFLKSTQVKQMPIEDPLALLRLYVAYFEKSYATPSPLLPIWGEALLLKTIQQKEDFIKKSFFDAQELLYLDEYQTWCFKHLECFSAGNVEQLWKETLDQTFSAFIKWTGKEIIDA